MYPFDIFNLHPIQNGYRYSHRLYLQKTKFFALFLGIVDWFIGKNFTELLPNPDFPLVFESIKGSCYVEGHSYYNTMELDAVEKWIKRLLNKQWGDQLVSLENIGVITPYKSQCIKLKQMLKRNAWDKLKIGSVEVFQGNNENNIYSFEFLHITAYFGTHFKYCFELVNSFFYF